MAIDPEYEDIRTPKAAKELADLLQEAKNLAHTLRTNDKVPVELREAAFKIETEADATLAFILTSPLEVFKRIPPKLEETPGVKYKRKRKGETTKGIIEFTEAVKKDPKYSTSEFKCIDDFDKCQRHRGNKSAFCYIALFVCIGKRIIPFVRHK